MVTSVTPHCTIWGYDFSTIVKSEGVTASGGAIKVEEIQSPGRKYADVREIGRQPRKYKIVARSLDREAIETFAWEVNTAPPGSEFYPVDASRCGYIASAWATITAKKTLDGINLYESDAEITCREAWLCGPDQGISMAWDEPLDVVSDALTNAGQERAPLSYLQLKSDTSLPYIENVSVRITPGTSSAEYDRYLLLCEKMARGQQIELGWQGDYIQMWEADLDKSLLSLSYDVVLCMVGGTLVDGVLTLDDGEYITIPFYGPFEVAEEAYIIFTVDAVSGLGAVGCYSLVEGLSQVTEIVTDDLVVGENRIGFPGLAGEAFVAIGIKAPVGGSVSISGLKGVVRRHVPPEQIPFSDPGETFKIRIEADAGDRLRFIQAYHNDRFWY